MRTALLVLGLLLMASELSAFTINPVPAISNVRFEFMPHRIGTEPVPTLYLRGCEGERVQAAFYIAGCSPVKGLMVKADAPCDLRWIKWWWQAGRMVMESNRPQYVPELLLHDGNLVNSSPQVPKVNIYPDVPQDASTLQPLDCVQDYGGIEGFEQGVFMTVVLDKARPKMTLRVTAEGFAPVDVPVQMQVYPFVLPAPECDYSIYYRPKFNHGEPGLNPDYRTPAQMHADLTCMVEHGIVNPVTYMGEGSLAAVLCARRAAGCDNRRLFTGQPVGHQATAEGFDRSTFPALKAGFEAQARRMVEETRPFGVEEVYLAGRDEADGVNIWKQAPLWNAVRQGGAKVWAASSGLPEKEVLAHLDDLQDVIVRSGTWPTPEAVAAVREAGKRTYVYGKPAPCEDPDGHRRHQGLLMFLSGVDGSMEYASAHLWDTSLHPWDEFGGLNGHWRPIMLFYPTIDGVVPTLQLEGFAAGVIDYRYLQKLASMRTSKRREDFWRRVTQESATVDLDAMRDEAARLIMDGRG